MGQYTSGCLYRQASTFFISNVFVHIGVDGSVTDTEGPEGADVLEAVGVNAEGYIEGVSGRFPFPPIVFVPIVWLSIVTFRVPINRPFSLEVSGSNTYP